MAKVVVIGATGHIGSFLVPRLVEAGHAVVAVSRGKRAPYVASKLWDAVERADLDRDALEADRRLRPGDPRARARHRRRHDLLPARERPAARRGAGRADRPLRLDRHHLDPRPFDRRARPARTRRSGPSAHTASTRPRPRSSCCSWRGRRASRRRSCTPATSSAPAGSPLNPAGNFNPAVFATLARGERLAAAELRARDRAPRPRRRHRPPRHGRDRQLARRRPARPSTPSRRPR